jgi:hypothetical protein
MRRFTIIVLCFNVLLIAQCQRTEEPVNTNLENIKHWNDTLQIIHDIVAYVAVDHVVEDKDLGSCFGTSSTLYPQFEWMNRYAANEVLVKLTRNRKPNVRAYAFWFLAKRHYNNLEYVYQSLKDDKAEVIVRYDHQWIQTVGIFCQWVVRDNDFDHSTVKFDDATLARLHAK